MKRRVFLVDDHPVVRAGIRSAVEDQHTVVGEAADVDEAVRRISAVQPEVVLLDVHLPGGGGVEVLRRLVGGDPDLKALALSVSDAPEDVITIIRAGARGYVTKSISEPDLNDAVERIAAGDAVFSPRLAGFVLDAFSTAPPPAPDPVIESLSEREHEVVKLIARGYTYREVGRELSLSVKTIESHMSSVLRKLQLSNRHELSRWAYDRRIV